MKNFRKIYSVFSLILKAGFIKNCFVESQLEIVSIQINITKITTYTYTTFFSVTARKILIFVEDVLKYLRERIELCRNTILSKFQYTYTYECYITVYKTIKYISVK